MNMGQKNQAPQSRWQRYQAGWEKFVLLWQDDKKAAGFGMRTVEDDERDASRMLIWVTAAVLFFGLLWASLFSLDEITRGQGKIIPSSREQVIQSLDSGVLREMLVREGDTVEKDQILLQMDDEIGRAHV